MSVSLIRALSVVDRNFHIEEVVADNGQRRVVAHAGDEQGLRIVTELASLYRFEVHPTEVASSGSVILVERAADESDDEEDEDLVGDDFEEEDEDDNEDSTDEGDDEEGEEGDDDGDDRISDLDTSGGLRYLNTAEGHKFATRVFTGMLGNEDMSRYAQFLIDLDKFFGQYVNKDTADFGERKKQVEEAALEIASSLDLDSIIEEAKKKGKNGRAGLLSALMKAISGDAGDAVVSAWDKGDSGKVKELLNKAVDQVASKVKKTEGGAEEAELEAEVHDENLQPGGKAAPSGA